jgi:hypothetical protein
MIQVLKQMVEALEAMQSYSEAERKGLRICDEAIQAGKQAIAELESQEPVAHLWRCLGRWSAYLVHNGAQADCAPPSWLVDAIKNATAPPAAKPEQEPAVPESLNWLTVVYKDIKLGNEAEKLILHPKMSAASWSHALNDRDAALATPPAAQPAQRTEQEPVAWISPKGHIHFDPYLDSVPLYTHPIKGEQTIK